jgi:hypothetical protein
VVDLLVNVKKEMALEILSTLLEELRSESANLRIGERLNTILLGAIHGGNNVD